MHRSIDIIKINNFIWNNFQCGKYFINPIKNIFVTLRKENLHNLYFSSKTHIITEIQLRRMRWAERVARMGGMSEETTQ
jgi:hypothetical protein